MKLQLKPITLKKDTFADIKSDDINPILFIKRLDNYFKNAEYLRNNNMEKMDSIDLYKALIKVFDIKLDRNDYIKILSMKNNIHYKKNIIIKTTMFDNNKNNILYDCIISSKANLEENDRLDLKTLRKLSNSEDLLLLKKYRQKDDLYKGKVEKEESFLLQDFNIETPSIDEDSELFLSATNYIQKKLLVKDVLYYLKLFLIELDKQRLEITGLSLKPDKNKYKKIGIIYKNAYDEYRERNMIPKRPKISVRYPKESKPKQKVKTKHRKNTTHQ